MPVPANGGITPVGMNGGPLPPGNGVQQTVLDRY